MSHKEYFRIIGEAKAYQDVVCANGWADKATAHTIHKGGAVIGAEVAKSDKKIRTAYYCDPCATKLLAEREQVIRSQEGLEI